MMGLSMSENDRIRRLLEEFEKDCRWFSDNYDKLEKKYLGKVVAVKGRKVIAVGESVEDLVKQLSEMDVDVGTVYMGTIPPKGVAFIL